MGLALPFLLIVLYAVGYFESRALSVETNVADAQDILYGSVGSRLQAATAACDVIYYNLDPYYAENHLSCPNNLFLALAAGKPLLSIDLGEIGPIVRRWECGYLMKSGTSEEIAAGLEWFSDPANLQRAREAAQRACREQYNSEHAERKLLETYGKLCGRATSRSGPRARGEAG